MGRHDSEPTMVGTSIALLQERFRQLQKNKQKRERKELLNLLFESNRVDASIMHLEPEPNGSLTSRVLDSNSLSLGLNLKHNEGKQVDIDIHEARSVPSDTKFGPENSFMVSTLRSFDTNVDTTLHL
uniref:Uncharacterized protein n=1 Tax=Cucumis melo TaxID=3656 RepID=A0A9I9DTY7_CUCME